MAVNPQARYTFENVVGDHEIVASFEADTTEPVYHTITATAGPGGSIDPGGMVQVIDGGAQTFLIQADPGFHITGITVDGAPAAYVEPRK